MNWKDLLSETETTVAPWLGGRSLRFGNRRARIQGALPDDTPSELQKRKINEIIDAGGKAYFIRSVEQLRKILVDQIPPQRYELKPKVIL